jgi:hypothetical protein
LINQILADNTVYPIGENKELVEFLNSQIKKKKIYLTLHGINHRNEDCKSIKLKNNFSIGAEFLTDLDLTEKVAEAIGYLESIFDQKIRIFTPPQNIYSLSGMRSVINNNLNVCCYMPPIRKIYENLYLIGICNYSKIITHRLRFFLNRSRPYPHVINTGKIKYIEHRSIQPGMDINLILKDIEYIHSRGGDIVLSTHSYAFSRKMKNSNHTLKSAILFILNNLCKKRDLEFVTIDKLLT